MTGTAHHRPMMTEQLGFSVLTAPIAAIDRRSLSQAWYSALRLARQSSNAEHSKPSCTTQAVPERKLAFVPHAEAHAPRHVSQIAHRPKQRSRADSVPIERRSLRSPLARKIEHLFLRPNRAVTRATFAIDGSSARVHVSMQQTRSGLRLVAVCPPRARERVARALEEARYALAARGVALDAKIAQ